ncbi:MAG: hypothetical protein PHS62_05195 [Patescibacteria group bacterium]|nr:hypothetical protein [Patescibacteria group bacterium]
MNTISSQGEKLYKQVLEDAKNDPNIVGLVLTAGRGKGLATEHSDYDVLIVVTDVKTDEYKKRFKKLKIINIFDLNVISLTEFKGHAEVGSETEWDRYNFAHIKAQIDKGGIQKLIDSKGIIPSNKIKKITENNLDGYINLYYRSIKNHRDGNFIASHLDAAESIPCLLVALFAMNGRAKPYNKYLEWELANYPLKITSWTVKDFMSKVKTVVATGDIEVQKKLFKSVKELFYKNGFTKSIDGWRDYYLG